eukprot:TRINITY_DN3530_c0_g1_i1.p1 TRINITY_DN3530_c0_g1~~TRINITY_DN3530_c0_g1_i1.p1  ORF type:complete len:1035 (-),score=159.06 TRINITY_DN3530_c0_g1_i1:317-3421(-)
MTATMTRTMTTTIATVLSGETDNRICERSGKGIWLPFEGENNWEKGPRAFMYFAILCWCFVGVAAIAETFMAAIEAITSRRKVVYLPSGTAFTVKVWNDTIANLTLMALGSSAPEILLSIIEIMGAGFYSGPLGPSTIVGSAAFNLLCIIAVCVAVIPEGENRTIKQPIVFGITAVFSVFAYLWLIFILAVVSPDVVEVWEGVFTFLFFPILVILAYLADIGKFSKSGDDGLTGDLILGKLMEAGCELSREDAETMAGAGAFDEQKKTWANYRTMVGLGVHGSGTFGKSTLSPKELSVSFLSTVCTMKETKPAMNLEVELVGETALESRVAVEYSTRDGTMETLSGHYQHRSGFIEIPAGSTRGSIAITADNTAWQQMKQGDEAYFWVELQQAYLMDEREKHSPESAQLLNESHYTKKVPILDVHRRVRCVLRPVDSSEAIGQLRFSVTEVSHVPDPDETSSLFLKVQRFYGYEGECTCLYSTEGASARPGYDYEHRAGEIVFPDGVIEMDIEIKIFPNDSWESNEHFFVVLCDCDDKPDTVYAKGAVCTVSILPPSDGPKKAGAIVRTLAAALNVDELRRGNELWYDQFRNALKPNGGDEREATPIDWCMHAVALPWKLVFAFCPPTEYCGGWFCFFVALVFIAALTVIVGDLASLLGCCLGIPDEITAITIVAMGTSLPDLFASKVAAIEDATADNAIGNVTGSNSVNVFLGIGMPWMMASIFWASAGANEGWKKEYSKSKYSHLDLVSRYPNGGFVVVAGDLVFAVIVFTICALCALGTIIYRRRAFKAELGGPKGVKVNTAIFFVLLWGLYIGESSWKTLAGTVDTATTVLALVIGIGSLIFLMFFINGLATLYNTMQTARERQMKDIEKAVQNALEKNRQASSSPFVGGVNLSNPEEVSNVLAYLQSSIQGLQQTCAILEGRATRKSGVMARSMTDITSRQPKANLIGKTLSSANRPSMLPSLNEKAMEVFPAIAPAETETGVPLVSPKRKSKKSLKKSVTTPPVTTDLVEGEAAPVESSANTVILAVE